MQDKPRKFIKEQQNTTNRVITTNPKGLSSDFKSCHIIGKLHFSTKTYETHTETGNYILVARKKKQSIESFAKGAQILTFLDKYFNKNYDNHV